MSIEELIAELQKYPGHFSVRAALVIGDGDDKVADFDRVKFQHNQKIVSLQLDGPFYHED